jgi:hypothetical protein
MQKCNCTRCGERNTHLSWCNVKMGKQGSMWLGEHSLCDYPAEDSIKALEEYSCADPVGTRSTDIDMPVGAKNPNPKDSIGSSKIPMHLWPETATVMGALGLLDGAGKYGRSNYRVSPVRSSIYYDALRRHVGKWFDGQDCDEEQDADGNEIGSGLPHLAHALACIAILVDAQAAGTLIDDRNVNGGGYHKLLETMTPHVKRLQEKHALKSPKHYTIKDND